MVCSFAMVCLFCEVNVIIDVILAEAVVALAAGAVTELKIGVIGIGTSAYGALTGVTLVLCFGVSLLCGLVEVDHIGAALIAVLASYRRYCIYKHITAEDKVVEYCCKRYKCKENLTCYKSGDDGNDKQSSIKIRQPLYFYGDNKEKQYAAFREESCKYEEHGEIDIGRIQENIPLLTEQACDHSVYYGAKNAADIVQREFTGTPVALKSIADEIVKVERDCQCQKIAAGRNEYKGYKAPYLTSEYKLRIKKQIRKEAAGSIHHEKQINNDLSDDNEQHEVTYSKIRMFGAKTVNGCG